MPAVLGRYLELTVRHRLELRDAFYVHDCRTMHPYELTRIEFQKQGCQGTAVEKLLVAACRVTYAPAASIQSISVTIRKLRNAV